MERQAEVYAATIAKLNTPTVGQGKPKAPKGRSIKLPLAIQDLTL
jgi:hypothetical protein